MCGSGCGSVGRASLLMPEVRDSNPDVGKFLSNIYLLSTEGIEKTKIKEKEAENGAFKKIRSPLPWPIHNTHT